MSEDRRATPTSVSHYRIVERLGGFEERIGPRFAAAAVLRSMAEEDLTFTDAE